MDVWNACTQEPNSILRWIECHPGTAGWAQAVGTILAIGVAMAVPWYIHLSEREAAARPEARYNASVRQALQDVRDPIFEFLELGPKYFVADALMADVRVVTFRVLWPITAYSSAIERLSRVLALRPVDNLDAMKAIAELNEAVDIRRNLIKRTIRGLNLYNSTELILREAYAAVSEEFVVLDAAMIEAAKAFPEIKK